MRECCRLRRGRARPSRGKVRRCAGVARVAGSGMGEGWAWEMLGACGRAVSCCTEMSIDRTVHLFGTAAAPVPLVECISSASDDPSAALEDTCTVGHTAGALSGIFSLGNRTEWSLNRAKIAPCDIRTQHYRKRSALLTKRFSCISIHRASISAAPGVHLCCVACARSSAACSTHHAN